MAIRKIYIDTRRDGYPYDRIKKQWYSWAFDIRAGGVRYQERGFLTKQQAEAAIIAIKNEAKSIAFGQRPQRSPFLMELLQARLDRLAGAERTLAKRVFTTFAELLPDEITVAEIKAAHIQQYISGRERDGMAAASIRRELVQVKAALNAAHLYFAELENYRPPPMPQIKISKQRKERVIKPFEIAAIYKYLFAKPERRVVGQFLQMLLLTASRPGEVAQMKPNDVDLENGIVLIRSPKTEYTSAKSRRLNIVPTMEAILRERIAAPFDRGYLFSPTGRVTKAMRMALKAACVASGIAYGRNGDGITFHTARHTATTALTHSGIVDTRTAGIYTNHSSEVMTLYYSHPNRETINIAANYLEQTMGGFVPKIDTSGEEVTKM